MVEPPSWRIARGLSPPGHAGIIVPSFAPGAGDRPQRGVLAWSEICRTGSRHRRRGASAAGCQVVVAAQHAMTNAASAEFRRRV